jgi:putative adhesin
MRWRLRTIFILVVVAWTTQGVQAGNHSRSPADPGRADSSRSENRQEEFRWHGSMASGRAIEVKGVNGAVRAEAASGSEVEVTASKSGRRSDPHQVEIRVVEHADGVTICAVYPSDNPSKPNECQPGQGGRMNSRNNDVKVDFTVLVPSGVRFIGRTVNGEVKAASLGSDAAAYTVNGSIQISTGGQAQAQTVNGSVTASLGATSWSGPLKFETVNGSITVEIPAGTNTQFQAETVNGQISTDFPLTVQGRINPKHITGMIGSGGRELLLKTVNGSIQVRRKP